MRFGPGWATVRARGATAGDAGGGGRPDPAWLSQAGRSTGTASTEPTVTDPQAVHGPTADAPAAAIAEHGRGRWLR